MMPKNSIKLGNFQRMALKMRRDYELGFTSKQVGAKYGCRSGGTVCKIFKARGWPMRPKGARALRLDAQRPIAAMHRDHLSGMTLQSVGLKYRINVSTVKKIFRRNRLRTLKFGEAVAIRRDMERPIAAMHAAYLSGMTLVMVGKKFGLPYTTIRRCFSRNGIDIRSHIETKTIRRDMERHIEAMHADYYSGLTLKAVGSKYGMMRETVARIFRRNQLRIRHKISGPS